MKKTRRKLNLKKIKTNKIKYRGGKYSFLFRELHNPFSLELERPMTDIEIIQQQREIENLILERHRIFIEEHRRLADQQRRLADQQRRAEEQRRAELIQELLYDYENIYY